MRQNFVVSLLRLEILLLLLKLVHGAVVAPSSAVRTWSVPDSSHDNRTYAGVSAFNASSLNASSTDSIDNSLGIGQRITWAANHWHFEGVQSPSTSLLPLSGPYTLSYALLTLRAFVTTAIDTDVWTHPHTLIFYLWQVRLELTLTMLPYSLGFDQEDLIGAFNELEESGPLNLDFQSLHPLLLSVWCTTYSRAIIRVAATPRSEGAVLMTAWHQRLDATFAPDDELDAIDAQMTIRGCIANARREVGGGPLVVDRLTFCVGREGAVFSYKVDGWDAGAYRPSVDDLQRFVDALGEHVGGRRGGRWSGFVMTRVLARGLLEEPSVMTMTMGRMRVGGGGLSGEGGGGIVTEITS